MTNCPNCGAPINPHKEKCEYCDTYYEKPTPQPPVTPPTKCKKSDSISFATEYAEILQMALSEGARQSKKPAKKEMPPKNDYDAPLWLYIVMAIMSAGFAYGAILFMNTVL